MSNVAVHNLAVTDCERLVTMAVPSYAEGGENLYEARIIDAAVAAEDRTVCVQAKPLDDLFGRLGRIDFVKCDVEAHELSVLRGRRRSSASIARRG
jgi:FkbM family methyltransferase